jgi:hypothetical protein
MTTQAIMKLFHVTEHGETYSWLRVLLLDDLNGADCGLESSVLNGLDFDLFIIGYSELVPAPDQVGRTH